MNPPPIRPRAAILALAAATLFCPFSPVAGQEEDLPAELYFPVSDGATAAAEEEGPADWGIPAGLALSAGETLVGDEILETADSAAPVAFVEDGRHSPAMAAFLGRSTWPGGKVPVVFSNESGVISPEHRRMFMAACAQWSQRANVRCLPRTNEPVFLTVFWGKGCFAYRGYAPSSQRNRISLGEWPGRPPGQCWNLRTVMHEIGHALGLSHEHQRPERDKYITVHLGNIPQDKQNAFMKRAGARYATPYDLESVMHYPAASLNGRPVITLNRGYERYAAITGRQNRLSAHDGALMASLYGKPGSSKDVMPVAEEEAVEDAEPAAAAEPTEEDSARDIEETEKKMKEAVERERRRQQAVPAPRKPEAKKEPPPFVLP